MLQIDPATPGSLREVLTVADEITALAAHAGGLAVGIGGTRVEVHGGAHDGTRWESAEGTPFRAINALCESEGIATDGSRVHGPGDWQRDLMEECAGGRVLRLAPGRAECLAQRLGHAFGAVASAGELWVSESWRHRVIRPGGAPVLGNLPGYPSRLAPARGVGFWLSVFACRTQLVEFVLRERDFREEMMRTIHPSLWVAPQVRPPASFLEPLQDGAIKQMGVLKPWAPPRSYGLVIRLDSAGRPIASLHSRVDGKNHGITAVAETPGALWSLSLGADALLRRALTPADTGGYA